MNQYFISVPEMHYRINHKQFALWTRKATSTDFHEDIVKAPDYRKQVKIIYPSEEMRQEAVKLLSEKGLLNDIPFILENKGTDMKYPASDFTDAMPIKRIFSVYHNIMVYERKLKRNKYTAGWKIIYSYTNFFVDIHGATFSAYSNAFDVYRAEREGFLQNIELYNPKHSPRQYLQHNGEVTFAIADIAPESGALLVGQTAILARTAVNKHS